MSWNMNKEKTAETLKEVTARFFTRGVLTAIQVLRAEIIEKQVFTRTELLEMLADLEVAQQATKKILTEKASL